MQSREDTSLQKTLKTKATLSRIVNEDNEEHLRDLFVEHEGWDDPIIELIGSTSLMMCQGMGACLYESTCRFCKSKVTLKPPVGSQCPLEIEYLVTIYTGWRDEVCPEGKNFSSMQLIKDLCMVELKLRRADAAQAMNGAIVELVAVAIDKKTGDIIQRPEATAQIVEYRNLLREKLRLMDQMGLTPKAKAAIGSTMSKDPSTYASEVVKSFELLMRKRQQERMEGAVIAHAEPVQPTGLPPGPVIDVEPVGVQPATEDVADQHDPIPVVPEPTRSQGTPGGGDNQFCYRPANQGGADEEPADDSDAEQGESRHGGYGPPY